MMNSANQTLLSSSQLTGDVVSRRLVLLSEIQTLELFIALAFFVAIHSLRQQARHGLPVWPFVGMLPSLIGALRTEIYEWLSDVLHRQNGTFTFKGPWLTSLNCVVTSDPRNLEHLLKTKFTSFPKGEFFRGTARDLLGDGIFNADDETWRRQRKTASIEFHSAEFRKMTTESLFQLVHSRLLPVLEDSIKQSVAIDLQDVLLRLTFDNVCMIAFGVDPGCLSPGLPEIPFARAFEDATEATMLRFVTPTFVWKAMRCLDMGTEKNLKKSIREVHEFADEVIRTRKKELSMDSGDKNSRSDLLTVFMGLKDDEGKPFSNKFLRDICVNFILAGRDTSSVALTWFFWLLYKNPEVEERILEEVCRIVAERGNSDNGEGTCSLVFRPEEVKKMDYLQAALSEALRLYPSVPLDHKEVHHSVGQTLKEQVGPNESITLQFEGLLHQRTPRIKNFDDRAQSLKEMTGQQIWAPGFCTDWSPRPHHTRTQVIEDEVFPDGTILKKGTKVIYAIYAMGRMESIWGKDCREFKPERWLRDGRFMSESAYKFTAFNGGPRLCLGKDFAYYQMKFAAASIIYRYRVNVVENHPVTPKLALTMYMKYGLKVTLSRRDESELKKVKSYV